MPAFTVVVSFPSGTFLFLLFYSFLLFFFPSADICVPISESVLSPHISALDEHNKLSTKDHSWRKSGKAQAKHSLKGKTWLRISDVMFKTWPPESRPQLWTLPLLSFLSSPSLSSALNLLWAAESVRCCTVCMSHRADGWRQSTNYVDNYPSAHISVSASPKHSMASLEETTMPALFLHPHEATQTLSLTAHIVWYTSENHRMRIWHDYLLITHWDPCFASMSLDLREYKGPTHKVIPLTRHFNYSILMHFQDRGL